MTVKEAFKSLVPSVFKSVGSLSSLPLRPDVYRDEDGSFFAFKDAPNAPFQYRNLKSCLDAAHQCPPLAAIINRKGQAFVNGKTKLLNSLGTEATSSVASQVRRLMANPNPYQSWRQFEVQAYIYSQIFGFSVILPIYAYSGAPGYEAQSLWNIPPNWIEFEESETVFFEANSGLITKATLVYKNRRKELPVKDLWIMRDFTPSCSSVLFPDSRIKANEHPVNNIIAAYKSSGVLITQRGPTYVVSSGNKDSSGATPMKPGSKTDLQNEFKRNYGITREQSMAIITNAAIQIQTIGFSTRDLALHEEISESTKALCDAFNVPADLMGFKGATYENQAAAEKGFYQNGIIPDAESWYEQFQKFMFGGLDLKVYFKKDYSHLQILQENDLERARARLARNQACLIEWTNDIINRNRWLELNGEPKLTDGTGDIYYSQWIKLNPQVKPNNNGTITADQPAADEQSGGGKVLAIV